MTCRVLHLLVGTSIGLSLGAIGCRKDIPAPPTEAENQVAIKAEIEALPSASEVTRPGHAGLILRVYWSPDGERLVTTDRDLDSFLWAPGASTPLAQFVDDPGRDKSVHFGSGGAELAIATGGSTWATWGTSDGSEGNMGFMAGVRHAAPTPDGTWFVLFVSDDANPSGAGPGRVQGYRRSGLRGPDILTTPPPAWEVKSQGYLPFAIHPDGKRVAIVSAAGDEVAMYALETGLRLETYKPTSIGDALVHGFSPDGKLLWLSSEHYEVVQYQADTGAYVGPFSKTVVMSTVDGVSRTGHRVLGASGRSWVVIDTASGAALWTGGQKTLHSMTRAALSPDGTRVAVPGYENAQIIDVDTGEVVHTFGRIPKVP